MRKRANILALLACTCMAFSPSVAGANDLTRDTIKNRILGRWTVVAITTHVGARTTSSPVTVHVKDVEPYGSNPKGVLVFEPNGRFTSTLSSSEAAKSAPDDSNLAALERVSGTYSLHPSRPMVILASGASDSAKERYVEITSLTASGLAFRIVPPPGGTTYSSLSYRRAE